MKAPDFLQEAKETMEERGKDYDKHDEGKKAERSMGKAVAAFNAITDGHMTESEGWLLMAILKQVRQWSSPAYHHDSAMDAVAYTALLAESLSDDNTQAFIDAFDVPVGPPRVDVSDMVVDEEALQDALTKIGTRVMDSGTPKQLFDNDGQPCCHNMGNAMRDPLYSGMGVRK